MTDTAPAHDPSPLLSKQPPGGSETLARLKSHQGVLYTAALKHLEQSLPWYRALNPDERAALGLVAQKGIASFVGWYERPTSPQWVLNDVFGAAPTELTRSISLQRALQLIRTIVEVVENRVPELAAESEQIQLREAVLRYSREVAFAAADVYARAAESRGAWDSRLEALVVDAVLRGEDTDSLRSRFAAVGWKSQSGIHVMAGRAPDVASAHFVAELRRTALRYAHDCLVGIQGERLIVMLGGIRENGAAGFDRLAELFGEGPVVYGPRADSLRATTDSAQAAFAGLASADAWTQAPRPAAADDLWPERVINGDSLARRALVEHIYRPLEKAGNGLVQTLTSYLALGHSLEGTARQLFVHANTVRYRLKRVSELTGWDPLIPREAFVLQTALVVGRLEDSPPL
ncbi:helix-turn-helix domain-containing protein [Zhihengliuella sp.]|uniref:PucR family transcriptional regulator n=1 Tax=Zhihengliuella sp. TaxID=1954483 RepID=UPI002810D1D0|nr:helix-turn-helix domain-containing protein [Zhihengliuella sp.]